MLVEGRHDGRCEMITVFAAEELRAAVHYRPVEELLKREGHREGSCAGVAGPDYFEGPGAVLWDRGDAAHCVWVSVW